MTLTATSFSLFRTIVDTSAPYVVTLCLGYVASSLRLGRKIRRNEAAHTKDLQGVKDTFTQAIDSLSESLTAQLSAASTDMNTRIDETDRRVGQIAQEVWGAQENNGMRGDIRKLKEDSEAQGKLLVKIDTTLDMIVRNLPSR